MHYAIHIHHMRLFWMDIDHTFLEWGLRLLLPRFMQQQISPHL